MQEKRHVGAEGLGQTHHTLVVEVDLPHAGKAAHHRGRIGRASAQTCLRRDMLAQCHAHVERLFKCLSHADSGAIRKVRRGVGACRQRIGLA